MHFKQLRLLVLCAACLGLLAPPVPSAHAQEAWWEACEEARGPGSVHVSADSLPVDAETVAVRPASPVRAWTFGPRDRVVVPHEPRLDIPGPFTIEVWCKPEVAAGYGLLKKHTFGYPAFVPEGHASWYLYTADKKTYGGSCKNAVKIGQWQHYCLTYDGERVTAYVDGRPGHSRPLEAQVNTPANPVMIGFSDGWAGKFLGEIGLARIYKEALSPDEIRANSTALQNGRPPPAPQPVVLERSAIPRKTFERALVFDGTRSRLAIPAAEGGAPRQQLLACAWIRPADTRGPGPVVTHGDGHDAGFQLILYGKTLAAVVKTTDGTFWVRHADCIEPERWQHIGVAWNGRTLQLFRNGLPVGPPGLATGTAVPATGPVLVGGDPGGSRHYQGEMGEVILRSQCPVELPAIPPDVGQEAFEPARDDAPPGPPGPRSRHLEGKTEKHAPLVTFDDMTGWRVAYRRGITTGRLTRSREQRCWGDHVAKIAYGGAHYQGVERKVRVLPPAPIPIGRRFDAVDLWTYPKCWGRSQGVAMTVHLVDADGQEHDYDLAANPRWFYWTGWYIAHRKLPRAFGPGTLFAGFTLHSFVADPDQVMYMDSLAFYVEDRGAIESHVPAWEDLPCPTTPDTILPSLRPGTQYVNSTARDGSAVVLSYRGPDDSIDWRYEPKTGGLSDIRVSHNETPAFHPVRDGGLHLDIDGVKYTPGDARVRKKLLSLDVTGATAEARWEYAVGEAAFPVTVRLQARRKSLIVDIHADTEWVDEVRFGRYEGETPCKLVRVPYLDMRGYTHKSESPGILCSGTFFLSGMQDWYNSDASELFGETEQLGESQAVYNGGAAYYPKTDGHRNPVRERFFVTLSSRFAEVLPNIPNPRSPYLSSTRSSFWITRPWYMSQATFEAIGKGEQPPYYEQEFAFWQRLHTFGVRGLLIRRHCAIWRQYLPMDGDPYTFVASTDPRCGGDEAWARCVQRTQNELGYRVGLYTNYTIVGPLSYDIWNENLVCLDPSDEWKTGSLSTAMAKVSQILPLQQQFGRELKHRFGVSCSYQDQITCRGYWGCTDYDRRVEGAAMHSAVFRVHARVLEQERKLYGGPVLSEGACHWFFAGLCDSNYAQTEGMDRPGLVDFQLLKIHPLNNDCGAEIHQEDPDRLAAYCIANGVVGHYSLSGHPDKLLAPGKLGPFLKAYFMLRAVQPHYAGVTVRSIAYGDSSGRLLPTDEAIRADAHTVGRTRVAYENGLVCWVNQGEEPWAVKTAQGGLTLPRNGYVVLLRGEALAAHALDDGRPSHFAFADDYAYVDGNGKRRDFGPIEAANAYVLRRQGDAAALIPAPFRGEEDVVVKPTGLGVRTRHTVAVKQGTSTYLLPEK